MCLESHGPDDPASRRPPPLCWAGFGLGGGGLKPGILEALLLREAGGRAKEAAWLPAFSAA